MNESTSTGTTERCPRSFLHREVEVPRWASILAILIAISLVVMAFTSQHVDGIVAVFVYVTAMVVTVIALALRPLTTLKGRHANPAMPLAQVARLVWRRATTARLWKLCALGTLVFVIMGSNLVL